MGNDLMRSENAADRLPAQAILTEMRKRGFLPEEDPLAAFPADSEFAVLDAIGRDLPSLLHDRGFRQYARTFSIPLWPEETHRR